MFKNKFKKSISIMLVLALIGTTLPCNATNNIVSVTGGGRSVVVPPSAPVSKMKVDSQSSFGGFSLQSMKSKIDEVINPKKSKVEFRDNPSGDCGTGVRWELNTDGLLNITKISPESDGKMYDYDVGNPKWYKYRDNITSVRINDGVTYIGSWAFVSCKNLTSVTIPDSVTAIGDKAFYYCSALPSLDIPASVENMGSWTFEGCIALSHICYLGTKAPDHGDGIFAFCPLDNVHVPSDYNGDLFCGKSIINDGCPEYPSSSSSSSSSSCPTTSGNNCGKNCSWELDTNCVLKLTGTGEMYNYDETNIAPWNDYKSSIISVIIEEGITSIGHHAFDACFSLNNVTIPNTVTSIGDGAFCHCASLEAVTIPDSVTFIENSAFETCVELKSVAIRGTDVTMGSSVFANCRALSQIYYLGTSDPRSGSHSTFDYCVSLDNIFVRQKGYESDNFCGQPVDRCLIIGTCGNSTEWILNGDIKTLTIYGTGKMANYTSSSATPWSDYSKSIEMITIENGITSIGDGAFSGCSALIDVTISASVNSIGEDAFSGCSALIDVTIPASVNSIGEDAFSGCSALIDVTIPASVNSIGENTFLGCNSLKAINVDSDNKYYHTIYGVLFDKDVKTLIQYPMGNSTTSYVIPDNVTSIREYAFYSCGALTNVTIPDTIISIGKFAFSECSALTNIKIPNSVKNVGEKAFFNCKALTSAIIGNSVASIGEKVFLDCRALTKVTIGSSVTSIGQYAFSGCSALTSVTIPDSVSVIGKFAFNGCSSLSNVIIPDSVTSIGESAFSGCITLTSVTLGSDESVNRFSSAFSNSPIKEIIIGNKVTSIGENAFYGCGTLTNVIIGNSVTSIEYYAFANCKDLKNVTVSGDLVYVGPGAFLSCSNLTNFTYKGTNAPQYDECPKVFYKCKKLVNVNVLKNYKKDNFCDHSIYPPKKTPFFETYTWIVISNVIGGISFILAVVTAPMTVVACFCQKRWEKGKKKIKDACFCCGQCRTDEKYRRRKNYSPIKNDDEDEEEEEAKKKKAEYKAKEEAARKAKAAKEEAERKAKAAREAKEEAERKAKEEAERKAKEEAERKAKEDAKKKELEREKTNDIDDDVDKSLLNQSP